MRICFSIVLDFDRFIYNIYKGAEFVENLLKAMFLTLRRLFYGRLFYGRLLVGRIHCICLS
jgi:hypothetical protein